MAAVSGQPLTRFEGEARCVVSPEDQSRAELYSVLSTLLLRAPSQAMLDAIAGLTADQTRLGLALQRCAEAARAASVDACHMQHFDLFVGVGRGELIPFASYYLTGFLQEKPLARLRGDIERLGLPRDLNNREPEDSAGLILGMMADLIAGRAGFLSGAIEGVEAARVANERRFFQTHIGSWMPVFFRDLAAAKSSAFYAAVGAVGQAFLAVEQRLFEMTMTTDGGNRTGDELDAAQQVAS